MGTCGLRPASSGFFRVTLPAIQGSGAETMVGGGGRWIARNGDEHTPTGEREFSEGG